MKMILEMQTYSQRQEALEILPADLHHSFLGITMRIRSRPNASAELGMRVLMWLHFAFRPLKLAELQHALAVKKSHVEFDARNIPSQKVLLDSCLGLVVVDEETMTVRFVHFTLEEYFRENAGTTFPNGCSSIAETCLTYLNFGGLRQHCMDLDSLEGKSTEYPFLNYAALYWGTYVRQQCSDSLIELAAVILEHESECPPCAIQALYVQPQIQGFRRRSVRKKISGVHVAAYFGLSENMARFYEVELKDEDERTPLSWAAQYGHEAVVRLLVERYGVDIESKDNKGQTPLMWAAKGGREAVVRLLIERYGVDIESKDNEGKTPFMWAAESGCEAVVRLLIERDGVDIDAKDIYGETPLMYAADCGSEAIVRLLIERDGVDIDAKDNDGTTPLMWAALRGREAVVRLLIERDGVDIESKDNKGRTPLMWAAFHGFEAVVRLLIERDGVDIDAKDNVGNTALSLAVARLEKARKWFYRENIRAIVQLLTDRVQATVSDTAPAGSSTGDGPCRS